MIVSEKTSKRVEQAKRQQEFNQANGEICICDMISKERNTINKERKWNRKKGGLRRECGKCPRPLVEGCRAISEKQ